MKEERKARDITITYCPNVKQPDKVSPISVRYVYQYIKDPNFNEFAQQLEINTTEYRRTKDSRIKANMPAVCWSALFESYRSVNSPHKFTKLILMDADHLSKEVMDAVMQKVPFIPYVVMAYTSISGEGLHIVVYAPEGYSGKKDYPLVQKQLIADLNIDGFTLDGSTCDIARCCFLNSDENAYGNGDATPMVITVEPTETPEAGQTPRRERKFRRGVGQIGSTAYFVRGLLSWYEKKVAGKEGGSTAYPACALAGMCLGYGYPEDEALEECWEVFGKQSKLTEREFRNAFSFIYRTHPGQLGIIKKNGPNATEIGRMVEQVALDITPEEVKLPFFPEKLFKLLPQFWKDTLALRHRLPHEVDAVTVSLLAICSAALSKTEMWEDPAHFPSVYVVVVGPPASGKSCVIQLRQLISGREEELELEASYNQRVSLNGVVHTPMICMSADTTKARLVEQLADNGSLPLLQIESEIDTVGVASKQRDTGAFIDVYRKAYELEAVGRDNKTAGTIQSNNPKLSFVLTGTPDQFISFFLSNQNGLTSRLTCYVFTKDTEYKKMRSKAEMPKGYQEMEQRLIERFSEMCHKQQNASETICWELSPRQLRYLNIKSRHMQENFENENERDTLRRTRAKIARFACILASVRHLDPDEPTPFQPERNAEGSYIVDDDSFRAAYIIGVITLEHNIALQSLLTDMVYVPPMKSRTAWRDELLKALPDEFSHKEALELCRTKFQRKKTVFENAKKAWTEQGLIEKLDNGKWRKVKQEVEESTAT